MTDTRYSQWGPSFNGSGFRLSVPNMEQKYGNPDGSVDLATRAFGQPRHASLCGIVDCRGDRDTWLADPCPG